MVWGEGELGGLLAELMESAGGHFLDGKLRVSGVSAFGLAVSSLTSLWFHYFITRPTGR